MTTAQMMMLVPKKGARRREALISTASTDMPEKKATVRTSQVRAVPMGWGDCGSVVLDTRLLNSAWAGRGLLRRAQDCGC